MTKRNRRRFSRFLCEGRVSLGGRQSLRNARLIDLSLKGALVEKPADWELPVGAALEVDIQLENTARNIHMAATVAHLQGKTMGVRCREIDDESISVLKHLIERSLADSQLLERELQALGR
jgi:hypothetical protein